MSTIVTTAVTTTRRRLLAGATGAAALALLPGCATTGGFSMVEAVRRLLLISSENAFARLTEPGGFWDQQVAQLGEIDAREINTIDIGDGLLVAHAAAHLDEQGQLAQFPDDGAVLGVAVLRTVQIHGVQAGRARREEFCGYGGGVVIVNGHAIVIALRKAHRLAAA